MKKKVTHLLFIMFQKRKEYSILRYDLVSDFYDEIENDLESKDLLKELRVNDALDLQELFVDYCANLGGLMTDKEFGSKWDKD